MSEVVAEGSIFNKPNVPKINQNQIDMPEDE